MRKLMIRAFGAALLVAASAGPARAQAGGGVHFGVAGGETFPVSDSKDDFKNGWHAGAMLTFGVPLSPVAVRVEAVYHTMNRRDGEGTATVLSGTANAIVVPASLLVVKPYFVGGAGVYRYSSTVSDPLPSPQTKFGWNAGGGIAFRLRETTLFVEARYHRVSTTGRAFTFVPVSVGLLF
jgi:opacity protein-like surface antigen